MRAIVDILWSDKVPAKLCRQVLLRRLLRQAAAVFGQSALLRVRGLLRKALALSAGP